MPPSDNPMPLHRALEIINSTSEVPGAQEKPEIVLVAGEYIDAARSVGHVALQQKEELQGMSKMAEKLTETTDELTQTREQLAAVKTAHAEAEAANDHLISLLDRVYKGLSGIEVAHEAIPKLGTGLKLPGTDEIAGMRKDISSLLNVVHAVTKATSPDAVADADASNLASQTIIDSGFDPINKTDLDTSSTQDHTDAFSHTFDSADIQTLDEKSLELIHTIRERRGTNPNAIHSWLVEHPVDKQDPRIAFAKFCELAGYPLSTLKALYDYMHEEGENPQDSFEKIPVGTFEELHTIALIVEAKLGNSEADHPNEYAITELEGTLMDGLFARLQKDRITVNGFIEDHRSELGPHPRKKVTKVMLPSIFWKLTKGLCEVLLAETEPRNSKGV